MRRIVPNLAIAATVLLLGLVAAAGVAWVMQAIPTAAKPDPPFPVPGKTPPIEFASIPWKRDAAHPERLHQPIAVGGMPWLASVDRPGEVDLPMLAVPWSLGRLEPANLTAAAVPWAGPAPDNADGPGAVVIQPAVLPWPLHQK